VPFTFEAGEITNLGQPPTAAIRSIPRVACRTATTSASDRPGTTIADGIFQTLHSFTFLAYPLQ
ncbi:hypothetical protein, partial [Bradyrhizobium liaoningense]